MSQGITPMRTDIMDEIDELINRYMTVPSIRVLARNLGVKKYSQMKKQELVNAVTNVIARYPIYIQKDINTICANNRHIGDDIINYLETQHES